MVRPIRLKVDEVYRKLQRLCDVLEGKPDVSHVDIRQLMSGERVRTRSHPLTAQMSGIHIGGI